jgi:hypothetical protein
MQFKTLFAIVSAATGLASAASVNTRQIANCPAGQLICGYELRCKSLRLLKPAKKKKDKTRKEEKNKHQKLTEPAPPYSYTRDQVFDLIRASGFKPDDVRADGLFRCTADGQPVWVTSCKNQSGVAGTGSCVGRNTQVPANSDAFCRFGNAN